MVSRETINELKSCLRELADCEAFEENFDKIDRLSIIICELESGERKEPEKSAEQLLDELGIHSFAQDKVQNKKHSKKILLIVAAIIVGVTLLFGQTVAMARDQNLFEFIREKLGTFIFVTSGETVSSLSSTMEEAFEECTDLENRIVTQKELAHILDKPILMLGEDTEFKIERIKVHGIKGQRIFWQNYKDEKNHYILIVGEEAHDENVLSSYIGGEYEKDGDIIYAVTEEGSIIIWEFEKILYRIESNLPMESLKVMKNYIEEVIV